MRHRPTATTITTGLLIAALLAVPALQAQGRADPAAQVDQRQARMKALGGAMKTLNMFAKGDATATDAAKAGTIVVDAGRAMPKWWPRGTAKGVGDSEAAPAIWTDQAKFRQRLAAFSQASALMGRAAATGDAGKVGAELRNLGGACKGCHDDYRLED